MATQLEAQTAVQEILGSTDYHTEFARAQALNRILIETPVRFWPTLFWLIQQRTPPATEPSPSTLDVEELELQLREVIPAIASAQAHASETGERAATLISEQLNYMSNSRRVVALAYLPGEFSGGRDRG